MNPSALNDAGPDTERLTLALNAAEGVLQVVLADMAGRAVYSMQVDAASRGVEIMTPAIASALSLLGKTPRDITRVAAVNGPGSFTGLRLATVTAAGLARTSGAAQAGISYMELVARQCLPLAGLSQDDAHVWAIVRARRDLVYMQAFARGLKDPASPRAVTGLDTLTVSDGAAARHILDTAILHKCGRVLLGGSGAKDNRDGFVASLAVPGAPRMTMLPVVFPHPETLLEAALKADFGPEDIEPLYVRASDAEENLPQIAAKLGLDPDKAVETLNALTRSRPEA